MDSRTLATFLRQPPYPWDADSPAQSSSSGDERGRECWFDIQCRNGAINDVIHSFVVGSQESERQLSRLQTLRAFCAGASLGGLEAGVQQADTTSLAILDVRGHDNKSFPDSYLGSLTAHKLFVELKKKVPLHSRCLTT